MAAPKAKGLGKGISAIIADDEEMFHVEQEGIVIRELPVGEVRPGVYQPRHHFDETYIQELADSIRVHGIIQPLVVRALAEGTYEIIAGERRYRAARLAGLSTVPAVVRELSDQKALEFALIENVQRQDLNPLEEAEGYRRLIDEFGHTQEALSELIGKSRSHIANLLRLLQLPESVKTLVQDGALSMGHARALLTAPDAEVLALQVVTQGLNVRQTEALVKKPSGPAKSTGRAAETAPDIDIQVLEKALAGNLKVPVSIQHKGQKGEIILRYQSLAELDGLLRKLAGNL